MNSSKYSKISLRTRNGTSSRRMREIAGDSVPLDLSQDPRHLLVNIFEHIGSKAGLGTSKNLGHLNNLIIVLCNREDAISNFSMEDMMICLKPALVSEVKEVRAACIRALRYLVNDAHSVLLLTKLHLDSFIIKCLDISHFNEVERIQCLRLIRKILFITKTERQEGDDKHKSIIPKSFALCVMSISADGAVERDRVYRTCLAILCELVVLEPLLVIKNGGLLILLRAILECHMYRRINEALCISLAILLNHPASRSLLNLEFNFSAIFAPYTDVMYRLHADIEESQIREEKEMRFSASKMAIVAVIRSWSGLLHLCQSSTLKSFLSTLLIPDPSIKRATLSVLFEVFCMNEPKVTTNFQAALASMGPKVSQESWQLTNTFVVGEGKWFLPSLCNERLDLTNCYMAVLLAIFIESNIIPRMVDVIMCSDEEASITASIFLGAFLNLCDKLHSVSRTNEMWDGNIASSCKECLPNLMEKATSKTASKEEKLQASVAVGRLQKVHNFLKKPPSSHSVYFDELMLRIKASGNGKLNTLDRRRDFTDSNLNVDDVDGESYFQNGMQASFRRTRSLQIVRSFASEQVVTRIKETKVFAEKDFNKWDWEAVSSFLIEGWTKRAPFPKESRFIGSDDTEFQFIKKLVTFYTPQEGEFYKLDRAKDDQSEKETPYVQSGCHLIRYLSFTAGEGIRILISLLKSIASYLSKLVKETDGMKKATNTFLSSCTREYFLLLGSLTIWPHGNEILRKSGIFQFFSTLANEGVHENLLKLLISSMSYSNESLSYQFLKKVLVSCNEGARMYGTSYLRILLRAEMPGFLSWGVNLLITQLYDSSQNVASEALDILTEACADQEYLNVIVGLRPGVLHLEKGALLVCRFASHPLGFEYLMSMKYLSKELDRWWESTNDQYVSRVEEMLNVSLTCFEKPNQQGGFVRRSGIKKVVQPVHVPSHLYGELCQHEKGCALLEKQNIVPRLVEKLKSALKTHEDFSEKVNEREFSLASYQRIAEQLVQIKSCLWALSHVGCNTLGLELIRRYHVIEMIQHLAENSPIYSIRGTCFYCLSVLSQTVSGTEYLKKLGWQSTLRKVWSGHPSETSIVVTSFDSKSNSSPSKSTRSSEKSSLSVISTSSHLKSSPASKSSGSSDVRVEKYGRSDDDMAKRNENSKFESSETKALLKLPMKENSLCESCAAALTDLPVGNVSGSLESVLCRQCGSRKACFRKTEKSGINPFRRPSLSTSAIVEKGSNSDGNLFGDPYRSSYELGTQENEDDSWYFDKIQNVSAIKYVAEHLSRYKNSAMTYQLEPGSIDEALGVVSESVRRVIEQSMGFVGIAVPRDMSFFFESQRSHSNSDAPLLPMLQRSKVKHMFSEQPRFFADSDESRSATSIQSSTTAFLEDVILTDGNHTETMHKEIIKLVTNLGSSVGSKLNETALLIMKEKFPKVFDSTSLFYGISSILSEYSFRLTARRFVQELFHDVTFGEVFEEANEVLGRYQGLTNS